MIPLVSVAGPDLGDRLAAGLASHGFVELTDHGVDPRLVTDLRRAADSFFDLPVSQKLHYEHPDPLANRGYRARGSEALTYSLGETSPVDLFESFNAGVDAVTGWNEFVQPTPWPDDTVPSLRPAVTAAQHALADLSRHLDGVIGRLLGLDDLPDICTAGPDMLACIDYRPSESDTEVALDGQMRMGAHTDYTSFTLLAADSAPGFQIVSPDGGWMDVQPSPGNLLMNVGDLLAIWTNDAWPSTLHRVVPMRQGAAPRRRTYAWFHYPDLDTVIEPLPRFVGADGPHYRPITVADHERAKVTAPKTGHLPPDSASTTAGRPT